MNLEDIKDKFRNGKPTHPCKYGNAEGIQQQYEEMLLLYPDAEKVLIFVMEWLFTPEQMLEHEKMDFPPMPFRLVRVSVNRDGTINL